MNKNFLKNILLAGLSVLLFIAITLYTVFIIKLSEFPTVTKIIFVIPLIVSILLILYLLINRIKIIVNEYSGKKHK